MKKSIAKTWRITAIAWLIITIIIYIIFGFVTKASVADTIRPYDLTKYKDTFDFWISPSSATVETAFFKSQNKDELTDEKIKNQYYMFASMFSDAYIHTDDTNLFKASSSIVHVIIDKDNNIIQTGVIGLVDKENCKGNSSVNCFKDINFAGMINITESFTNEEKEQIQNVLYREEKYSSIRLDKYKIVDEFYVPLEITVLKNDTEVLKLVLDEDASDAITSPILYIHDPNSITWNTDSTFKNAQSKTIEYAQSWTPDKPAFNNKSTIFKPLFYSTTVGENYIAILSSESNLFSAALQCLLFVAICCLIVSVIIGLMITIGNIIAYKSKNRKA